MNAWQTEVLIKKPPFSIPLGASFYIIGSCFSDHLKKALIDNLFRVTASPFGIEYNPISISQGLKRILSEEKYVVKDLISTINGFTTWSHHSKIKYTDQYDLLKNINTQLKESLQNIKQADYLMITLGTAYSYYFKDTNIAVNNCHKKPQELFIRKPSSIEQMINALAPCLEKIRLINNKIKFIFTLSPVKHLRDDPTENSYSKALCRCGIEELIKIFKESSYYFPAYEIMTDELRDYRFYDRSMTHPSEEAVQFIISKFFATFLETKDNSFQKEWAQMIKFLNHKNNDSDLKSYLDANLTQKNKILSLRSTYSHLNWAPFSQIF